MAHEASVQGAACLVN